MDETVEQFPIPTPAPTTFPTLTPTEAATNPPKPAYVASDFNVASYTVVTSLADVTMSPSKAPTGYPTLAGYSMVAKEIEVKVVETSLNFAISAAEANNPGMQLALSQGMAASLGMDASKVQCTHVNGVPTTRRLGGRKLGSGTDISFGIESASNDAAQVEALKETVKQAAQEGSVVSNVQKAANTNGVLVESLKNMPTAMPEPTMTESSKTTEVYEPVRSNTPAPSLAPVTPAPTPEADDDDDDDDDDGLTVEEDR